MGDLTWGLAARRRRFALARDHAQSSVRESCDYGGDGKRRRTSERIRMYVPRPLIEELRFGGMIVRAMCSHAPRCRRCGEGVQKCRVW